MLSQRNKFIKSQRGNVAILTAGITLPLIALVGGVIEFSELTKIQKNLQDAADNAVIAAYQNPKETWAQRTDRVNNIFAANLAHKQRLKFVKSKLEYHLNGRKTVVTYKIKTAIKPLFGAVSPFGKDRFSVASTGEFDPKTRRAPHLIPNAEGATEYTHGETKISNVSSDLNITSKKRRKRKNSIRQKYKNVKLGD